MTCPHSRSLAHARRFAFLARGFTLIELLIVVAMISILSGAFFTVVIFCVRAEAEDDLRSTLRQEGLMTVRSILRDTYLARDASETVGGSIRSDSQTLVLNVGATRTVAYRLKNDRLERVVQEDKSGTPTVQMLSTHVRTWQIKRSGGLVHVGMVLAINRYTKDFVADYGFATQVGGMFEGRRNVIGPPPAERTPATVAEGVKQ